MRHVIELVLGMYVGMAFLGLQIDGPAAALGNAYLHVSHPQLATLLMALEMALPMAVWMDHRGHSWRSVAEMSAATLAPAPVAILVVPSDPMGLYHVAMLASMLALW